MFRNISPNILKWVIITVLALVWGSSFILMKRALDAFSPMQVGMSRILITALCLLPFGIAKLKKLKRRDMMFIAMTGIIGNGTPALLFAYAQKGLDSQVAGILNSLSPLFALLLGLLFFKMRTKWYNIIGVIIGFTGAVGLLSAGMKSFSFNFSFGSYIILATFLYAVNINMIKRFLKECDALSITAFAFMSIGPFAFTYLAFDHDFFIKIHQDFQQERMLYIIVLSVIGTGLAGILYNYMLKISSVLFAASVTYFIPVVAIIWGFADGESFYPGYILWIMVIFAGVFLVNKKGKSPQPSC